MQGQRLPFALFFLSGISGLIYQIVWLRLAFAAFGIVTPVVSIVISVFMFGLGAGSLLAGNLVRRFQPSRRTAFIAYAAAEFVIGIGGLAVPTIFGWGDRSLLQAGQADSITYLGLSALVVLAALFPFCLAMGMTFPLMMQALRVDSAKTQTFSYLYLANVLGALCGTFLTPVALVELLGFHGTLMIGVAGNWLAAAGSLWLSRTCPPPSPAVTPVALPSADIAAESLEARVPAIIPWLLATLFWTGLSSMGMEVVWTRAFAPVLRTQVYSFSGLLFTYLLATWIGSAWYRRDRRFQRELSQAQLLIALAVATFAQILATDPRVYPERLSLSHGFRIAWTLAAIVPYCTLLGYLTPKLIDQHSQGDPTRAGRAYALNVAGCILGPLIASYLLLPFLGAHRASVVLALPLWSLASCALFFPRGPASSGSQRGLISGWGTATALGVLVAVFGISYEEEHLRDHSIVFRDHTATVVAVPETMNHNPNLFVNGTGITAKTTSTKLMAHLPLAFLDEKPHSALVICFGMGTTYRSLLSWGIDATAVELVPGVKAAFPQFFSDTDRVLANPHGKIVIDDGRRYIRRTTDKYDVITIDPPPPVEAAGSSLLYSKDFYTELKTRLTDKGILQQWYPEGDEASFQAALRAVVESFPHVRAFRGLSGFGCHLIASMHPIPDRTAEQLMARMPAAAIEDLREWGVPDSVQQVLGQEIDVAELLNPDASIIITDDRPFNEYYLLRYWQGLLKGGNPVVWSASPGPK